MTTYTSIGTPVIKSPVVIETAKKAGQSAWTIVKDLFKNKGVQAGVGLGAAGLGLLGLSAGAKEATQPFGELSPFLVIGIVAVFLILLLRSK